MVGIELDLSVEVVVRIGSVISRLLGVGEFLSCREMILLVLVVL